MFEQLVARMSEVYVSFRANLRDHRDAQEDSAFLAEGRRSRPDAGSRWRTTTWEQIRKPIDNQDLYDGCTEAFRRGWRKVKLYFMCGLPGERPADLDGIVAMAEAIARVPART